jgi:diguanylate cyclase (GGDEF)-like protein/PAS domain S-box-containing protein
VAKIPQDDLEYDLLADPRSNQQPLLIAIVAVLAVLLFSMGCYAVYSKLHDEHRANKHHDAEHQLLSFETSASRLFDSADSYLRSARAFHDEARGKVDWDQFIDEVAAPHSDTFSAVVTILDRNGRVLHRSDASEEALKSLGSMANSPQFRHFADHLEDTLYISPTHTDADDQKPHYHCARPLFKDGHFDGVVMLTLEPEFFIEPFRRSSLGPQSTLLLVTTEPKVIARQPPIPPTMYEQVIPGFKDQYGIDLNLWEGRSLAVTSPFDGRVRDVLYKRLANYPVATLVGIAHEDIDAEMANTRRSLTLLAGVFGLTTLLVAFMMSRIDIQNRALARSLALNHEARQQLRIAAAAFDSQECMMITDRKGTILRVNHAFTDTTGFTAEEAVGKNPLMLRSGRHEDAFYDAMREDIAKNGSWQGEIWNRRKDGEEYPKWLTISAVKDAQGEITHYVGTYYDVSERKRAEERIRQLAFFDQLTGLPNRTLLLDRLNQAIADTGRSGNHGALLFIDLDNFKTLNDALGHDKGDLLLQQVAERLKSCIREGDTAARLGGDEFVVMLKNLGERTEHAAALADKLSLKILEALTQPYALGEQEHHCSASIGVTLFGGTNRSREDLLKQADLAMYQAKAAGRNTLRFFDPEMQVGITNRIQLERELRIALRQEQLCLHYQPQVDLQGRCTGAEVLVRWQHPERGLVYPNHFIPVAEETSLILPIGLWVLEDACRQLRRWADDPAMRHLTLSVNVSGRQLHQPDFVDQVLAILQRTGAPPETLKLELTESLLVNEVEKCIAKMNALTDHGIQFALDDFGTGYSSLSYLKRLPLAKLKIDRSFVQDVLDDPNDAAIVRTIIALAETLGLAVLAEGVETHAQRDFLADNGCHWYQGYLFGRPVTVNDFEAFARSTGNIA